MALTNANKFIFAEKYLGTEQYELALEYDDFVNSIVSCPNLGCVEQVCLNYYFKRLD